MRRTPVIAVVLAAYALAAGCGDDDDDGGGNGSGQSGGGGGLYGGGGGGGEDEARAEDESGGEEAGGEEAGGEEAGGEEAGGEEAEDGGGAQAGAPTRLRLAADPGGALAFDKSSLRAKPGRVVIAFDNPSPVPHAVEVEGNDVEEETETITDSSARLAVNLDAGEYKFYCPVGNHEQAGMVGTLTVR